MRSRAGYAKVLPLAGAAGAGGKLCTAPGQDGGSDVARARLDRPAGLRGKPRVVIRRGTYG